MLAVAGLLISSVYLSGQSVLITDNTSNTTPDASAILEVESSSSAMLFPRLTLSEIDAIAIPSEGLMLYDTDDNELVFYDGTDWLFMDGTTVTFSKKKSAPLIPEKGTNSVHSTDGTVQSQGKEFLQSTGVLEMPEAKPELEPEKGPEPEQ